MNKPFYFSTAPLPPVVVTVMEPGLNEATVNIPVLKDPAPLIDIERKRSGVNKSTTSIMLAAFIGITLSLATTDLSLVVMTWLTGLR